MNRKEAAELLPIIQAFAEGKDIEYRSKEFNEDWKEVTQIPGLSFESFEYRIKPEPKYRPFTNIEECWAEMEKHKPFGWLKQKDFRINIANVMSKAITFADNEGRNFSFETIFKEYTFVDDIPFGVKEE